MTIGQSQQVITWTEEFCGFPIQHSMSIDAAAKLLKELYSAWPGGLDEIYSAIHAKVSQPPTSHPTMAQLESMVKDMEGRNEISWAGYRKGDDGQYTIPCISQATYALVLGALKNFT